MKGGIGPYWKKMSSPVIGSTLVCALTRNGRSRPIDARPRDSSVSASTRCSAPVMYQDVSSSPLWKTTSVLPVSLYGMPLGLSFTDSIRPVHTARPSSSSRASPGVRT